MKTAMMPGPTGTVFKEHKAKLVIIEPLAACLAGPDANKDQEIRRVLYKLSKIAERNNCSIIVLRHLNKSGGGKAIYRGNMWPARISDPQRRASTGLAPAAPQLVS